MWHLPDPLVNMIKTRAPLSLWSGGCSFPGLEGPCHLPLVDSTALIDYENQKTLPYNFNSYILCEILVYSFNLGETVLETLEKVFANEKKNILCRQSKNVIISCSHILQSMNEIFWTWPVFLKHEITTAGCI